MTAGSVPPIPATCEHRPTIGGRVIPYVNVRLRDGGVDFRRQHRAHVVEVLRKRWCQVCATPLTRPIVLFGGPDALKQLLFDEPPLHPECAIYGSKACPSVAGQLTETASGPSVSQRARGQKCFDPDCDCEGWIADEDADNTRELHPWYAVFASNFSIAMNATRDDVLGALLFPEDVLVVRLVSRPGEGRCWTVVPDALDGYEAPDMRAVR